MSQIDPFERWLADAGWAEDVDEGVAGDADAPDPWRGAVVAVDGLSDAQLAFLEVDQPLHEHLRPDLPGIDGYDDGAIAPGAPPD
jgi:hypothetical protein